MTRRHLVILTATVNPPANAHKLARSDPALRLNDYQAAWLYYLKQVTPFADLLLVENSGFDMTCFQEAIASLPATRAGRATAIGCNLNDFPPEWGRGYGEFVLLNHLANTTDLTAYSYLWKVTGRVIVTNLARLICTSPQDADLYCDCRRPLSTYTHRRLTNGWMDMRVFGMSPRFFHAEIANKFPQMKHPETGVPEVFLFREIDKWKDRYTVCPRFRCTVWLKGHAGYDNKSFASLKQQCIYWARWACRGLTPWLWV